VFIGHYASSIAISSLIRERGALTFISFSAVLPDVFMLATGSMNSAHNFHSDRRFFICLTTTILMGILFKFERKTVVLALFAVLVHLPLDIPYSAQDSTNLYAHPGMDFSIEVLFLALASCVYAYKQRLKKHRLQFFLFIILALAVLQGAWNFAISSSLLS
jgi:hypothetical protein